MSHSYKEEKWIDTFVRCAATFMIRRSAIRIMEYLRELNSKSCPTTGSVLSAAPPKLISKRRNKPGAFIKTLAK